MLRKQISVSFFLLLSIVLCRAQDMSLTARLLERNDGNGKSGSLSIIQAPGIDSLIYRYILYNERLGGMEGYRIQIYSSSDKNAREESGRIRAEFISKFPDIVSYASFERPGYYKIRAGDYRTRAEGTKYLLMVRKVFPDAYLVPDIINFPDLNKK
jgi:hypothetical protein